MKLHIIALLIACLCSCEKEVSTAPTGSERHQTGTWMIYPVGNAADSFAIFVWSDVDSLYNVRKAGTVASGPVSIAMISGVSYTIGYRNPTCDSVMYITDQQDTAYHYYCHKFISHKGSNASEDFTDSIPATIF